MPELSLHNIDQISRDISRQEITFSHLLDDLIDHICCDVEYEMQSGLDFLAAYGKVKQKMGSRRLKEIQEETLYAVDLKYRHMKNTMKISGIAGTVLLGFGALFKIQHWPLSGTLMVLGLLILCLVAYPWYTWISWKDEAHITPNFLYLTIGLMLILLPGALINMNLSQTYEEGFYSHQEQQKALYGYLYRNNNSLLISCKDSLNYPAMEQFHSRTAELINYIGGIESGMISQAEGKPGAPVILSNEIIQTETGPAINYPEISKPFQTQPVTDFLLPGSKTREALNALITEYKAFISGLMPGEELSIVSGLLDISLYLPDDLTENSTVSLMSGLHSLELLKNGLLTVESGVLKVIANHK